MLARNRSGFSCASCLRTPVGDIRALNAVSFSLFMCDYFDRGRTIGDYLGVTK